MIDQYDASSSLLGYLYQCRYALLSGIELSKSKPGLSISIEKFDDVAFESGELVKDAIQTKHHGAAGDLSDKSVDLWKTLNIWCDRIIDDPKVPFETRFKLVTTGTAPDGSAAAALRFGRSSSDIELADSRLTLAAQTSTNQATKKARSSFLALTPQSRLNLLNATEVLDNAPNITDVRSEIESTLYLVALVEHVPTLVDYLEGWWFSAVIDSLQIGDRPPISVSSIRSKIDELREAFKSGNLPLDSHDVGAPSSEVLDSDNRIFVRQLRRVSLSDRVISNAARDYYRASAQRSRWARENLLLDGETQIYDEQLVDRWTREFEAMKSKSDPDNDGDKEQFGRGIFHWANRISLPFRNRGEMWLSAGSYQILADRVQVGWHPDFLALFAAELEEE